MTEISRRQALARIGAAAAAVAGTSLLARAAWDRAEAPRTSPAPAPRIRDYRVAATDGTVELAVARQGGDPAVLTRAAIDALGGMARFVAKGDVVVLKPNVGWDRTPAHAANTSPIVVATLVTLAREAGAARVVVTDASCNEPARCFQRSGIGKAAHDAGAEVVLPAEHRFQSVRLGGAVLHDWPVLRPVLEADKVINVPIAKHHNLARFTGALKNWYGLLGGRRNRLHQRIDLSIADLATFLVPTLTVVDATRVLMRNGPQGGNLADTRAADTVIASLDQVAADAYACALIEARREDLGYLALAEARGLGTTRWESLRRAEV